MPFFTRLKPLELPVKYSSLIQQDRWAVRQAYVEEQKGLCYHCKHSLHIGPPNHIRDKRVTPRLYPDGFFDNPVHLHHDHNTDLTLGAVHAYCNAILWEYYNE